MYIASSYPFFIGRSVCHYTFLQIWTYVDQSLQAAMHNNYKLDEHLYVNKSATELAKLCNELVGRWSISCDDKSDAPTATGRRDSAAGAAQNQGGVCRELGSEHNWAAAEVTLPRHWGPWGKSESI